MIESANKIYFKQNSSSSVLNTNKLSKTIFHRKVNLQNLSYLRGSITPLSKCSKILPLTPILVNNLIKVGGRIQHSNIPDQQKETILPAAHQLTSLIINPLSRKISSI